MYPVEPPFGSPAASIREVRGFASPPRGGFAFVEESPRSASYDTCERYHEKVTK